MADWLVACDGETFAWRCRAGFARRGRGTAGETRLPDHSAEALCAALGAMFEAGARRGDRLRLALGSLHMRVAALPWPRERLHGEEQAALLRSGWAERLDDVSAWWLGVEGSGAVRLATALRRDQLDALEATASAHGVTPAVCLPAAALALRAGLASDGAAELGTIELEEGPRTTRIGMARGRLSSIASAWRAPAAVPRGELGASKSTEYREGALHGVAHMGGATFAGGPRVWLEWL